MEGFIFFPKKPLGNSPGNIEGVFFSLSGRHHFKISPQKVLNQPLFTSKPDFPFQDPKFQIWLLSGLSEFDANTVQQNRYLFDDTEPAWRKDPNSHYPRHVDFQSPPLTFTPTKNRNELHERLFNISMGKISKNIDSAIRTLAEIDEEARLKTIQDVTRIASLVFYAAAVVAGGGVMLSVFAVGLLLDLADIKTSIDLANNSDDADERAEHMNDALLSGILATVGLISDGIGGVLTGVRSSTRVIRAVSPSSQVIGDLLEAKKIQAMFAKSLPSRTSSALVGLGPKIKFLAPSGVPGGVGGLTQASRRGGGRLAIKNTYPGSFGSTGRVLDSNAPNVLDRVQGVRGNNLDSTSGAARGGSSNTQPDASAAQPGLSSRQSDGLATQSGLANRQSDSSVVNAGSSGAQPPHPAIPLSKPIKLDKYGKPVKQVEVSVLQKNRIGNADASGSLGINTPKDSAIRVSETPASILSTSSGMPPAAPVAIKRLEKMPASNAVAQPLEHIPPISDALKRKVNRNLNIFNGLIGQGIGGTDQKWKDYLHFFNDPQKQAMFQACMTGAEYSLLKQRTKDTLKTALSNMPTPKNSKYAREDVVNIGLNQNGELRYITKGEFGLEHIKKHSPEFAQLGVRTDEEITELVIQAATYGEIVGQQSAINSGRPVYRFFWKNESRPYYISVSVDEPSGFITGANSRGRNWPVVFPQEVRIGGSVFDVSESIKKLTGI